MVCAFECYYHICCSELGSGMVLQRNKINCVYGTAEVYSDVIMEFRGTTSITQADEDGKWKIELLLKY